MNIFLDLLLDEDYVDTFLLDYILINCNYCRLASSLMSQKEAQQPVATPEIQSSIKEVTSAIVHYVNDQTNRGSRSRSVSPSAR